MYCEWSVARNYFLKYIVTERYDPRWKGQGRSQPGNFLGGAREGQNFFVLN